MDVGLKVSDRKESSERLYRRIRNFGRVLVGDRTGLLQRIELTKDGNKIPEFIKYLRNNIKGGG